MLAALAALEIVLALSLLYSIPESALPSHSPAILLSLQMVVFGGVGGFLLFFGKDRAAGMLGVAYLLIASAYAYLPAAGSSLTAWVRYLPLDAFLPYILWQFARCFPQRELAPGVRRAFRIASISFFGLGCWLLLCNVIPGWVDPKGHFERSNASLYTMVVYLPSVLAMLGLAIGFSAAVSDERERARFFLLALAVPMLLISTYAILAYVPAYREAMASETGRVIAVPILHAVVLSVPISTAYAIALDKSVRLNVLFTVFVRYRLARAASWFLVAVPMAAVCGLLWSSRARSLEEIADSVYGPMLLLFFWPALPRIVFVIALLRGWSVLFFERLTMRPPARRHSEGCCRRQKPRKHFCKLSVMNWRQ